MKALQTIGRVFVALLTVAAVAMMIFTIVSVRTFDRNDRDLFGYKAYIVRTDSMSATDFDAGDLVLVKEVDPVTLREGDIVAFISQDADSYGETFTHKIRSITVSENGERSYITYGTTTDTDDPTPTSDLYILGKYQFAIPRLGTFFTFLKTTPGYICCILLPFLILIGSQGVTTVRIFKQYRAEQMEEIARERAGIEAEREESRRMMAELLELKAQLARQQGGEGDAAAPPEEPAAKPSESPAEQPEAEQPESAPAQSEQ